MFLDMTLWLRYDIYEALRAERSIKFVGYDPHTSHNTPVHG